MFAKIFSQILDSSIAEDYLVRLVFEDMLILADRDGIVDMTPRAIAARTNVPIEIVRRGIDVLSLPDPESRNPDQDGRRIMLLDAHRNWGWRITNYDHYRRMRDEEGRRSYFREYQAGRRNRNKGDEEVQDVSLTNHTCHHSSPNVTANHSVSPKITEAEAEVEGDVEVEEEVVTTSKAVGKPSSRAKRASDERHTPFREALAAYYRHKNPNLADMPWQGRDARALSDLLEASPNLTLEQFRELLRNRARSPVAHGDRIYLWIAKVHSFSEPLNQYNKPEGKHGKQDGKSASGARLERSFSGLEQAVARRLAEDDTLNSADDSGIPEPGDRRGDGHDVLDGV